MGQTRRTKIADVHNVYKRRFNGKNIFPFEFLAETIFFCMKLLIGRQLKKIDTNKKYYFQRLKNTICLSIVGSYKCVNFKRIQKKIFETRENDN